jgi:hypothetical protein
LIEQIKIYNRFSIKSILDELENPPSNSWYAISIYSSRQEPLFYDSDSDLHTKLGCKGFLSIQFDDITPYSYEEYKKQFPDLILFNDGHAKKIIEYIDKINNEIEPFDLVIHCQAGISRSGAVGEYASKRSKIYFYDNQIRPNPFIYRTLLKESGLLN